MVIEAHARDDISQVQDCVCKHSCWMSGTKHHYEAVCNF